MTQTGTHNNDRQPNTQNDNPLSQAELTKIWARRAEELAKEPPAEATGQTIKLLIFRLGSERYGIDVTNVQEIHPLQQLTPVPRAPDFSVGVFSARGRILSVIDLQAFLGLPTPIPLGNRRADNQAKIIVVSSTGLETASLEVGFLADEVSDVITIFKEDIEPPLTTHAGIQSKYLHGIAPGLLVVLNLNALLSDKRLIVHEEIV